MHDMKKLIAILIIGAAVTVQFTSCTKCYTCDFGNGDVREFCPKDFPDKGDGLKMTIDAYEKQGYKCNSK